MKSVTPAWRSLHALSPTEAAMVAKCRRSSPPAILRVTCLPGTTNFALKEQMRAGAFRWAVYSSNCIILAEGLEPTLEEAGNVAVETQRLWTHRCDARGLCRCVTQKLN